MFINKYRKLILYVALILILLAVLLVMIEYLYRNTIWFGGNLGILDKSTFVQADLEDLPQESLFITDERLKYSLEEMYLIIPRLDLNTVVGIDTLPNTLIEAPGLYEYAQMPNYGDVNVSIAGHRDMGNQEFYALETMCEGDFIYLIWKDEIFKYAFYQSKIIAPNDWSVIARQGFSAVTLTTCNPIGTNINRLVVVGNLIDRYPLTEESIFI